MAAVSVKRSIDGYGPYRPQQGLRQYFPKNRKLFACENLPTHHHAFLYISSPSLHDGGIKVTFSLFSELSTCVIPASSFFQLHKLWEPCFSSQSARYPFCDKNWDGSKFNRLMCIQYELSVYYPYKLIEHRPHFHIKKDNPSLV